MTTYESIQHLSRKERATSLSHLFRLVLNIKERPLTPSQIEGFTEDIRTLTGDASLGAKLLAEHLTALSK